MSPIVSPMGHLDHQVSSSHWISHLLIKSISTPRSLRTRERVRPEKSTRKFQSNSGRSLTNMSKKRVAMISLNRNRRPWSILDSNSSANSAISFKTRMLRSKRRKKISPGLRIRLCSSTNKRLRTPVRKHRRLSSPPYTRSRRNRTKLNTTICCRRTSPMEISRSSLNKWAIKNRQSSARHRATKSSLSPTSPNPFAASEHPSATSTASTLATSETLIT